MPCTVQYQLFYILLIQIYHEKVNGLSIPVWDFVVYSKNHYNHLFKITIYFCAH
jgi:hypothetical protein